MAQFPKSNPVYDGNAFVAWGKQPDGIELDFGATGNGILTSVSANGAWPLVIQQVEQVGTIEQLGNLTANLAFISKNGANSNVGVRIFTTGSQAVNVTALTTAIQSLFFKIPHPFRSERSYGPSFSYGVFYDPTADRWRPPKCMPVSGPSPLESAARKRMHAPGREVARLVPVPGQEHVRLATGRVLLDLLLHSVR